MGKTWKPAKLRTSRTDIPPDTAWNGPERFRSSEEAAIRRWTRKRIGELLKTDTGKTEFTVQEKRFPMMERGQFAGTITITIRYDVKPESR